MDTGWNAEPWFWAGETDGFTHDSVKQEGHNGGIKTAVTAVRAAVIPWVNSRTVGMVS